MTVSEHVYTAVLIGSPDRALSVRGGSITLDAGSTPHVTATLDISRPGRWEFEPIDNPFSEGYGEDPYGLTGYGGAILVPHWVDDPELLSALDPRETPRVRITAAVGGTTREFDLGIRDVDVSDDQGNLSLTLASDEALLEDYAPLADDTGARAMEGSLRSVVNYVLNKAIPGEALEAVPDIDADATAYWAISNLIFDSSFETGVSGIWGNGTNASGFARQSVHAWSGTYAGHWRSLAAGVSFASMLGPIAVREGTSYVFTSYVRATTPNPFRLLIRPEDSAGRFIAYSYSSAVAVGSSWTRLSYVWTAPPGASRVTLHVEYQATAADQFPYIDGLMFYEGTEVVPYFDGGTPDDAGYAYGYTGDTGNSVSTRTPVIERAPESLTWRAGQTAMDFLHPLIQAAGFRLVCDERRRWTLRDESYRAPGSLAVRYGVNMQTGSYRISRDSGLWFDAAVTIYTDPVTQVQTVDSYALTTPHTRLRTFEKNTPYPGPGFSQYAVRRAQGRGREVSASLVADWTAQADQRIQITLPNAPLQTGTAQRVTFDLDNDGMTVTARTTDTPPLAWVLGPEDLTWTDAAAIPWADVEDWSDIDA